MNAADEQTSMASPLFQQWAQSGKSAPPVDVSPHVGSGAKACLCAGQRRGRRSLKAIAAPMADGFVLTALALITALVAVAACLG